MGKQTNCQLSGDWKDGNFVRGKWIMSDLSSYHGCFKDGQPIGEGLFVHSNGLVQEGIYGPEKKEDEENEEKDGENSENLSQRKFQGGKIISSQTNPEDVLYSTTSQPPVPDFVIVRAKDKNPLNEEGESEEVKQNKQNLINCLKPWMLIVMVQYNLKN